jgi:hypothetical protein
MAAGDPIFDSVAYEQGLKTVYEPEINYQQNDMLDLKELWTLSAFRWEGLVVKPLVSLGRGHSYMAVGSMSQFPSPVNEITKQAEIYAKWMRGSLLVSEESMVASATSKGAWMGSQEFMMERFIKNQAREENRMFASGSGTGVLCLVAANGVGTTALTVDSPAGVPGAGWGTRYCQVGMKIAIHNSTTIFAIRTITAIAVESATAGTLTLNAAVSALEAPNDAFISRVVNDNIAEVLLAQDTSYGNEPMGLGGIIDDGTLVATFQGLLRSTYPDYKAVVIPVTAISLDALQQLDDTINDQGEGLPTHYAVQSAVKRAYTAGMDVARGFMQATGGPGNFDLGLEPKGVPLKYNARPILESRDIQIGEWLAVNKPALNKYELVKGEWASNVGGSILIWDTSGRDAFMIRWRKAFNYGTRRPNAHGKLTGIPTGVAIRRHNI